MRTKKVKSAGKFGVRYGVKTRHIYREIDEKQRLKYVCPKCGRKRVKRESTGIWVCKKCNTKFAGGAYVPETIVKAGVEQTIKSILGEK
ncbi:MAG: 50S ribosomal protein L37Ae [Thermoplasmatales archaeon]|nr:50S ribosomal protein L37Ae [Thermoplasmatales archaeon]